MPYTPDPRPVTLGNSAAAVKDTVVEAVDQLYLQCDALQAARNLAALAVGGTLGELGSLEEVVQQLIHRNMLDNIVLKVWVNSWVHAKVVGLVALM